MSFDINTFAAKLRGKRAEADISQEELARRSGVSSASIKAYENGQTSPLLDNAYALAEALGCSINDICGWNDPDTRTPVKAGE